MESPFFENRLKFFSFHSSCEAKIDKFFQKSQNQSFTHVQFANQWYAIRRRVP